ncbi:hypothetical protein EJ02DRAFT_433457 [Clathrospora elynae]|uniref:Uncharacterized protein n=1 Tax=Clathrospora elynae TaxID=706981 RepID=A0A6A5T202_9PLEO|nr:hypothetical protein EJ02DRAFT_433457 [Clathrospora elynae]
MSGLDLCRQPLLDPVPDLHICAWLHVTNIPEGTVLLHKMYLMFNPIWAGLRIMFKFIGTKQREPGHMDTPDQKLLQQPWEDLKTAIEIIGPQSVFVTPEPPVPLKDCMNRMRLAMGAKAQDFVPNKRSKTGKIRGTSRGFHIELRMLEAIMHNYGNVQVVGKFRINIFAANTMDAIIKFLLGHSDWGAAPQPIKAKIQSLGFEHYLRLFMATLQMELGYCPFDYAGVAADCSNLLLASYERLVDELQSGPRFYMQPREAW